MLEVGCGTGFVLTALRDGISGRIAGSELHSEGLKFARKRHGEGVELIQMDARRLLLVDALDVVCALDVIEHIREDEAVIASVHQALRPGGWFIVSVPQHPWLWSANDEVAHHERRYRVGELQKKLRDAGFSVVYSDSFTSLLLPAMAASRLLERFSTKPQPTAAEIADREFKISGWLNGFFRERCVLSTF